MSFIRSVVAASLAAAALASGAGAASARTVHLDLPPMPFPVPATVEIPDQIPVEWIQAVPGAHLSPVAPLMAPGRPGVVGSALSRLGDPYVWGGSAPGAFDCSGLIQWSYAQNGIHIPRTSYDQLAQGRRVADLQPGDILSFYNGGHVGMYIGDGKFVHAPQEGQPVVVQSLNAMPAEYAVRY